MRNPSLYFKKNVQSMVVLGMLIVLAVAGYASWKQYERYRRITTEVSVLEVEKERVRRENESLKERISYFATENFQEQESKERLNMRKDNEYVVDIEKRGVPAEAIEPVNGPSSPSLLPLPNYRKWWEKIF